LSQSIRSTETIFFQVHLSYFHLLYIIHTFHYTLYYKIVKFYNILNTVNVIIIFPLTTTIRIISLIKRLRQHVGVSF